MIIASSEKRKETQALAASIFIAAWLGLGASCDGAVRFGRAFPEHKVLMVRSPYLAGGLEESRRDARIAAIDLIRHAMRHSLSNGRVTIYRLSDGSESLLWKGAADIDDYGNLVVMLPDVVWNVIWESCIAVSCRVDGSEGSWAARLELDDEVRKAVVADGQANADVFAIDPVWKLRLP